jgi:hypothetical protein
MLLDDCAYTFDGSATDALLFGLAIDDVAGGGNRHTGQLGDITEFQPGISLFFRACLDNFANPNRFTQAIPPSRSRQVGLQGWAIIE